MPKSRRPCCSIGCRGVRGRNKAENYPTDGCWSAPSLGTVGSPVLVYHRVRSGKARRKRLLATASLRQAWPRMSEGDGDGETLGRTGCSDHRRCAEASARRPPSALPRTAPRSRSAISTAPAPRRPPRGSPARPRRRRRMGLTTQCRRRRRGRAVRRRGIAARLGSLDILVNNAGITRDNLIHKMTEEDWDAVSAGSSERGVFVLARGAARDGQAQLGTDHQFVFGCRPR